MATGSSPPCQRFLFSQTIRLDRDVGKNFISRVMINCRRIAGLKISELRSGEESFVAKFWKSKVKNAFLAFPRPYKAGFLLEKNLRRAKDNRPLFLKQ